MHMSCPVQRPAWAGRARGGTREGGSRELAATCLAVLMAGQGHPDMTVTGRKKNTSMEGDKATGEGHVINKRVHQIKDKGVAGEGALTRTTSTRDMVMAPVTTVPTAVTQGVS
jgi:hypothetical protein